MWRCDVLYSEHKKRPGTRTRYLRRRNGGFLEVDIIDQSSIGFDEALPILQAQALVTKGQSRWDNRLHLLSYRHLRNHIVDSINDRVSAELKHKSILLSLGVSCI